MKKTILKALAVIMAICVSFVSFFQNIAAYATDKLIAQSNKPPEGATCYAVGPMMTPKEDLENQKYQLKNLEEMFKKKQVTQQAYETRKKDLLKRIQELEKGNTKK